LNATSTARANIQLSPIPTRQHQDDPEMSEYHSRMQLKNMSSALLYLTAAALAHVSVYIAYFIYVLFLRFTSCREKTGRRLRLELSFCVVHKDS
jgi:hypothetical protein